MQLIERRASACVMLLLLAGLVSLPACGSRPVVEEADAEPAATADDATISSPSGAVDSGSEITRAQGVLAERALAGEMIAQAARDAELARRGPAPEMKWVAHAPTPTELPPVADGASGLSDPAELAKLRYPFDAKAAGNLDVLVDRDGGTLVLRNRTAHDIGRVQVWLNQHYVGYVDALPIQEPVRVPIQRFYNLHREPYPVGGFLAPDKTSPLMLAEIYDTVQKTRIRLHVIATRSSRG